MSNILKVSNPRNYIHSLTENETQDMKLLFSTAAKKSPLWLALNQPKMKEYKAKLYHLHPLTFIEATFENQDLCNDLKQVHAKGFVVWGAFTRNVQRALNEEQRARNLFRHIPEFAKRINLPEEKVLKYLKARNVADLFCHAFS